MLLRKDVLAPPEQLLAQDIEHYAKIFNDQRAVDIETVCLEAEAEARQLKVQPDSPVCLLFGIEVLPAPVESAIFSLSIAEGREPFVKAYALLWHLIRRDRYGAKLRNASHSGAGGTAAIELGIHPGNDGMCCIGLRRRNPLMLLGQESELAHFHGVASSIAEAREIGRVSAELISRQFDVDVKVELMESAPKRSGPYDAENT